MSNAAKIKFEVKNKTDWEHRSNPFLLGGDKGILPVRRGQLGKLYVMPNMDKVIPCVNVKRIPVNCL